ncbi:hypothetical protein BD413DRAFT_123610 [Trametes elegans]|nr:hypothetical protein BD413DRAFT_123610 [Trametes elegans]
MYIAFAPPPSGLCECSISAGEIETIRSACLSVPINVDTFKISLSAGERTLGAPAYLTRRIRKGVYTWAIYIAETGPDERIGLKGDVWVDSRRATRQVFVREAGDTWVPWGNLYRSDAQPGQEKPLLKHVTIYHPWLRHRRLEFDGVRLQWGVAESDWETYMQRLDRQVLAAGWATYENITLDSVAERLCTASPSPTRHVVFPARPIVEPRNDPPAQASETTVSALSPSIDPDAFRRAQKAFPPPGLATSIAQISIGMTFPASLSPKSASVKAEEERSPTQEHLKRSRDPPSPLSSPIQLGRCLNPIQPGKRLRLDQPNSQKPDVPPVRASAPPSLFCGPATSQEFPPVVGTFATIHSANQTDLGKFLRDLPQPMSDREPKLRETGVTSVAYLESFARAPPSILSGFTAKLQQHGFTFIEALILRNGLTTLPAPAAGALDGAQLESVEAFLGALRPSMAHHASIFKDLGVEAVHLPILARMNAVSYAEFDQALQTKGLTWADCFLIKIGLQTRYPA